MCVFFHLPFPQQHVFLSPIVLLRSFLSHSASAGRVRISHCSFWKTSHTCGPHHCLTSETLRRTLSSIHMCSWTLCNLAHFANTSLVAWMFPRTSQIPCGVIAAGHARRYESSFRCVSGSEDQAVPCASRKAEDA